jgi:hypothetical protein
MKSAPATAASTSSVAETDPPERAALAPAIASHSGGA